MHQYPCTKGGDASRTLKATSSSLLPSWRNVIDKEGLLESESRGKRSADWETTWRFFVDEDIVHYSVNDECVACRSKSLWEIVSFFRVHDSTVFASSSARLDFDTMFMYPI